MVGTGDLSETALGWSTYSGDHISMYHVNVGVPKTLVRHLVDWYARHISNARGRTILLDILDTPISPELIHTKKDDPGKDRSVGPYELNDFFLYYAIRHAFDPKKILFGGLCFHVIWTRTKFLAILKPFTKVLRRNSNALRN